MPAPRPSMPASVGARPGTSVAAASPHQRAEAEAEAAKAARERVARRPQVAQHDDQQHDRDHEADDLADGKPPVAAPSIGSPDIATSAGKVVGGLLEPLAGGRVELRPRSGRSRPSRRRCGRPWRAASVKDHRRRRRAVAWRSRRARRRSRSWGSAPCSALNTSVACVPDCAGKRCSSRSWARCDSMPGTVKSSLKAPPTAMAPPITAARTSEDGERRAAADDARRTTREDVRREDMARE